MPIPEPQRVYRSLPHKRSFYGAMLFSALWFLTVVGALTLAFFFVFQEDRSLGIPLILTMSGSAVFWLIAYAHRRSVRCPLCKGTPLLDNRAAKHSRARRVFPLNYGSTALLTLLLSQRFRCMFCGNPFDLLKKPGNGFGRDQDR